MIWGILTKNVPPHRLGRVWCKVFNCNGEDKSQIPSLTKPDWVGRKCLGNIHIWLADTVRHAVLSSLSLPWLGRRPTWIFVVVGRHRMTYDVVPPGGRGYWCRASGINTKCILRSAGSATVTWFASVKLFIVFNLVSFLGCGFHEYNPACWYDISYVFIVTDQF